MTENKATRNGKHESYRDRHPKQVTAHDIVAAQVIGAVLGREGNIHDAQKAVTFAEKVADEYEAQEKDREIWR